MKTLFAPVALFFCLLLAAANPIPVGPEYDTLADLLTHNPVSNVNSKSYVVKGRTNIGDGFEGLMYWVPNNSTPTNNDTVFAWGSGRLFRMNPTFISGTTNTFTGFTVIYTNATLNEFSVTNIIDKGTLIITNSIVEFTNTTVTINGTNVATINPTIGRVPYKSGTNEFSDSSLVFVDTNTTETVNLWTENVGVTNLVTGGVVVSFDSGSGFGYLTNFPAGAGYLLNNGANVLSWDTSGLLWTNDVGTLRPSDTNIIFKLTPGDARLEDATGVANFEVFVDNQNTGFAARILDTNGFNHALSLNINPYSMDGNTGFIYVLGTNTMWSLVPGNTNFPPYNYDTFSTVTATNLWQLANQTALQFFIAANTDAGAMDGSKLFGSDGKFHDSSGVGTIINATDRYLPARQSATSFTNSPLYTVQGTNIALDGQMIFGPGTTNVLYRDVNHLVYTNSGTTGNGVLFDVINGNGVRARFGVDQDEQAAVIAPAGKFIRLGANNENDVYVASATGFYPIGTNYALGLGTTTNNYWKYAAIGSSNQWGFMGVTSGMPNVEINGTNYALSTSSGTTINATDTYLPARLNSTTFTNSPLFTVNGTNLEMDLGGFTIHGPTNTASSPILDLSQVWNNGAITFTALHINVTNTASLIGNLIDAQVAANSQFTVRNGGTVITAQGGTFQFNGRTQISSSSDNTLTLNGSDGRTFSTLNFGQNSTNDTTITLSLPTGTNINGGNLIVRGGNSTGTGRGGAVEINTANSSTTGNSANAYSPRTFISAKEVDLSSGSAVLVFNLSLASGKIAGIHVVATTHANDASDFQVVTDDFTIAAMNKGGTVSTALSSITTANHATSGTIATVWTAVANGNSIDVKCAETSTTITPTTNRVKWRVEIDTDDTAMTITPQ